MAGFNEYDTFTYEKAPDYTKSFDEAANLDAWGPASKQEAENAKVRMANAKQVQQNVDKIYKLAPSLAKYYIDEGEKRDKRLMNKAYQLHMETGITLQKLTDWNRRNEDKEGYLKDVGFYHEAAAKAEQEGNYDLASRLRNITGHRLVMAKQSLLRRAGMNWKAGWDANKHNISIDRGDDLPALTLGNAKDANEYNQLVAEYNIQLGLNDISWASPEFIDENFRGTYERQHAQGLAEWQRERSAAEKKEIQDSWVETLTTGAGTNNLGETIIELMKTDFAYSTHGNEASMREDIANILGEQIALYNDTNGEKGIDPATIYKTLDDFTFWHRGDKKEVALSKFKEFDSERGGGLNDALIAAQTKRLQARNAEQQGRILTHKAKWDAGVEEHGLPTKADRAQAIIQFRQDNPDITTVPAHLLNAYTVEDRDDDEIIEAMYAKAYRGVPLTTSDWSAIQDKTKRDAAKQFAQGPGGSGIADTGARDTALKSAVSTKLSQFGLGTRSTEYNIMLTNATAAYNKLYIDLAGDQAFGGDKAKLHEYVAGVVEKRIERGEISGVRAEVGDPRSFTRSLNEGRKYILESNKDGKRLESLLSTELIPGSEEQFKRLEAYAQNPQRLDIPQYYKQLAEPFRRWGPWDIANMQYKSQTGKELPMPKSVSDVKARSPLIQYMYNYKPSGRKIDRAEKMDSGHDFNSPESLIPGLVV